MKSEILRAQEIVNKLIKDNEAPQWLLSAYNKLIDIYETGDNEAINKEIKYFYHTLNANKITNRALEAQILADNEEIIISYLSELIKSELGNGVIISEADFYNDLKNELELYKKERLSGLYSSNISEDIKHFKSEISRLKKLNKNNTLKIIL